MGKRERIIRMLLLTVTAACLWACSAADDSGRENQKERAGRESSADLGQFAGEKGSIWNDTWSARTTGGASVQVNLMAFIEIPAHKQMSTVEVQRYDFTEENKRKAAEGIFGGEVYLNDEKHLPKPEIRELLDTWLDIERRQQKALEELKQEEGKEGEIKALESDLKTDRATVKRYERLMKTAPEDYIRAEGDFTGKEYIGTREGIRYKLDFVVEEKGAFCRICIEAHDIEDIYPEELKGKTNYYCTGGDIKLESANQCSMDRVAAEKTARQFLQKAGFGGLILTGEETLQWINGGEGKNQDSEAMLVDGWRFTFSPGAEGVPLSDHVDFFDYSGGITETDTMIYWDKRFSPDCSISIDVTDRGVIQANLANPVTVISSVPGVKLLPLADIKNVIRNEIGNSAGLNQRTKKLSSVSYNRLTLGYYRVSDPGHDDLYTYLPAWRLWSNKNGSPSFVVNAMDGSVIDDWEEKWEIVEKAKG